MNVLTIDEVAAKLKMSPLTVRQYLREGKLPGVKLGRHWRVLQEELEKFVHARQEAYKPTQTTRRKRK